MNTKEKKLLDLLKTQARLSNNEIATKLEISQNDVEQMIQDFEEKGVILQYTAIINEQALPENNKQIRALVEVCIRPENKSGYDKIADRIRQYQNVIDLYLLSGHFDFLVMVEGKSLEEISTFVANKLASIDNVRSTATHFIMRRYKEKGIILGEQSKNQRLAISL